MAFVVCLVGSAAGPHRAEAEETGAPNVAAARRHYDKARADYEQGAYREAIAELDAAHALDPSAKDLVFNLGVVHEKLGDIDDALQWFRLYSSMNLTAPEADRAEAYTRRLEGAKKELEQSRARRPATPDTAPAPAPAATAPAKTPEPPPPHGRIDALTIATAGFAAAGLLTGVTLAVKATADSPASSFVTGRDGTYADLVSQTDTAHAEAVAADVAFSVGLAAGIACAYLYLTRPRASTPSTAAPAVSATPILGGAAIVFRGTL